MSLNKVLVIGNLGADPEIRTTQNSTVVNFRVACTEKWKDKSSGEQKERTEWVNCVVWGKSAEYAAKAMIKGTKVYVEGRLQTRSWDDKTTGAKRYATEVHVDRYDILEGKHASPLVSQAPVDDSDLPF